MLRRIAALLRASGLALVAFMVVFSLGLPVKAEGKACSDEQMLGQVVILSVTPVKSNFTWNVDELVSFGEGKSGTYPNGQLEVKFNDINTGHRITHYDVIATPSDEPGTSKEYGVEEEVVKFDRPVEVGSTVTAVLDLEPGTNYDVDVVAYHYTVQISPNQSNQDSFSGTTYLSPPFFGSGTSSSDIMTDSKASPSGDGVHFLVYKPDQELHRLYWLNPEFFGPYDHEWNYVDHDSNSATDKVPAVGVEGADILCVKSDGELDANCEDGDLVGITHYRVSITDENGSLEYIDHVEKIGSGSDDPLGDIYSAEFNLNDGTYTFAVDGGFVEEGDFYALSDKAQFVFSIPDDYRKYNQTEEEVLALLDDVVERVAGEDDDFDPYYDSVWNDGLYDENSVEVPEEGASGSKFMGRTRALIIFLNNLYN